MKKVARSWFLPLLLCCALSSAAFANDPRPDGKRKKVAEGGSSVVYLSLAAVACVGAVAFRSRNRKAPKLTS